jgi:hypothetical protein
VIDAQKRNSAGYQGSTSGLHIGMNLRRRMGYAHKACAARDTLVSTDSAVRDASQNIFYLPGSELRIDD